MRQRSSSRSALSSCSLWLSVRTLVFARSKVWVNVIMHSVNHTLLRGVQIWLGGLLSKPIRPPPSSRHGFELPIRDAEFGSNCKRQQAPAPRGARLQYLANLPVIGTPMPSLRNHRFQREPPACMRLDHAKRQNHLRCPP